MSPESLRAAMLALVDRIDPAQVSPEEARAVIEHERQTQPERVAEALAFLARVEAFVGEMDLVPTAEQHRRLEQVQREDPDLAARVLPKLSITWESVLSPREPYPLECAQPGPDGYELHEELGRGGMAVVYRAQQLSLGRQVALKMVLAGRLARIEDLNRFRKEAEAIASLQHLNIVGVYDFGESGGHPYFSLEFCAGGSLAGVLQGNPLAPRIAAGLVKTMALAVEHAHQRGFVHRDLKPANVLLLEGVDDALVIVREKLDRYTLKIADFGLARQIDGQIDPASVAMIAGTPSYMAPEQTEGGKQVGPRADIYALGAILYELLTGRPPFQGPNVVDTLKRVREDEPVSIRQLQPRVPRDLETITMRCLNKNPDRRFGSAAELADDLERFLENRPIRSRAVGRMERTVKLVRRRPVISVLVAAVVLLTVFGVFGVVQTVWAENKRLEAVSQLAERDRDIEIDRRRALEEKQREEKARRHEEIVAVARRAAENGNWRLALERYDKAIGNARGDELLLRIERLPGLFLHGARTRLAGELEQLKKQADRLPPRYAARLLLFRGDFALCDDRKTYQGRALVREALNSKKLEPADEAYARGMLAERPVLAVPHFRKAVELNRVHARANHALLMTFVLLGDITKARSQIALFQGRFPDDPVRHVAEAILLMIEGAYPASLAEIDKIRPLVDADRYKRLRLFFERFVRLHEKMTKSSDSGGLATAFKLPGELIGLVRLAGPDQVPFSFNIPLAYWIEGKLADMQSASWAFMLAAPDHRMRLGPVLPFLYRRAIAQLEPILERDPEPVYLTLAALAHWRLSACHELRKETEPSVAELSRATELFHRASEAPSCLPLPEWRYVSLLSALATDHFLLRLEADGKDEAGKLKQKRRQIRAQETFFKVAKEGRRSPKARRQLLEMGMLAELPQEIAEGLLSDWQQDVPSDAVPRILHIQLLLKWRKFSIAYGKASDLYLAHKGDKKIEQLYEQAKKNLLADLKLTPAIPKAMP